MIRIIPRIRIYVFFLKKGGKKSMINDAHFMY